MNDNTVKTEADVADKRYRIVRAIAEADPLGPGDFDEADASERRTYYRMGMAALNAAHVYAVHTLDTPAAFLAVATIPGEMTITRDRDPYEVWGEPHRPGEPEHLVIGVSDGRTARAIARALNSAGVPSDITDHRDWAERPGDLAVPDYRSWRDWEHARY